MFKSGAGPAGVWALESRNCTNGRAQSNAELGSAWFRPELSPAMRSQAIEAIGIVRCQYVLTPYVKPARREAS
jgi:hypothetical protein